jgi:hypothetical protein
LSFSNAAASRQREFLDALQNFGEERMKELQEHLNVLRAMKLRQVDEANQERTSLQVSEEIWKDKRCAHAPWLAVSISYAPWDVRVLLNRTGEAFM